MKNGAATFATTKGILEIGNHPPPICGWSIQTTLVRDELRRRGVPVAVLNINENRRIKSDEYVDVQSGLDYLEKVTQFALRGYRFHIHCNARSKKGYVLSLVAALIGRALSEPAVISFHGGVPQELFPVTRPRWTRQAFKAMFGLCGYTTCDSEEVRREIVAYGIDAGRVRAIPCISEELLEWKTRPLPKETELFLSRHHPMFLSYVRWREEYTFDVLLEAMKQFVAACPRSGFIWAGPSEQELAAIRGMVDKSEVPAENVLVLGNMDHDSFLTIMARSCATIRAYVGDGICASVLESLALSVPVVACEDGRRPEGVVTYDRSDAGDLYDKLVHVVRDREQVVSQIPPVEVKRNTDEMVELLLGE